MTKRSIAILCIFWITVVIPTFFVIGTHFKPWVFFLAIMLVICAIIAYQISHKPRVSASNDGPLQNSPSETQCAHPLFDDSFNTSPHDTTHHYSYTDEYNILNGRLPGSF